MFNTLKRLYLVGSLLESGLDNAIKKGWITEEQKLIIINSK